MKPRCIFPQWLKPFIMLVFVVALSFGGILNTTAFAGGPTPLSPLDTQDDVSISNVAISSIKGQPDSVLIKWRTSLPVKAWVEYGSHPNKLDYVAYNTRGADTTTRTHKILIRGIDPNNFYFYIVLANGHRFGNAGKAFQFVTTLRNPVSVVAEPVQVAQVSTITSNKTLDMATQIEPTLDTQSKTNIEANSPDSTAPILAPDSEQQATSSSSEAGQIQSEVTASAQDSTTTAFVATIPSMKLPWASGTQQFTGGPHGGNTSWACSDLRSLSNMSGLDFGMALGTEVLAVAAGTVVFSGYDTTIGYAVGIDHGNNFGIRYWHLSSIDSSIKIGVQVKQGQLLGKSGSPPGYNSPHLHLEFRQWNGSNWNTAYPAHGIQIDGYTARAFVRTSDNQGFNYQGTLTRGTETKTLASYCGYPIYLWSGSNGTITASAYGGAPVVSTNVKVNTGQSSVTIQQVYTTDGNGVAKTSFRPGDTIRYYARVNNSGSASVAATLSWLANGPAQVASWSGTLTIAPGTADWYLGTSVPANAPSGTYTLRVQATYNGTTSQATSNFTVAGTTAVTIQQVYTTDGNGVAKTSFRPGDTIRYYARVNNSGSASVAATLSWLANGPAQVASWSGTLTIAPGTADWYLGTSVPANAPSGTYTLRVQATYNGTTSQATSNFTINTQSLSEIIVDELSSGFSKSGPYWWDDTARGFNGHMYWTYVNGSTVSSSAIWRPNLPVGRSYEVFAYIPDYHTNTVNARYEIHYGGNSTTIISRQQAPYSNQWISLGTYSFDAGTSGYIRLTDASGEAAGSKQIGFDAIKWVPR